MDEAKLEYRARNENFLIQQLNIHYAHVLYLQRRYDEAKIMLEEANQYFSEQGASIQLSKGLFGLIEVVLAKQSFEYSKSLSQQYLDIALAVQDSFRISNGIIKLALSENQLGNPEKALQYLESIKGFVDKSEDIGLKISFYKMVSIANISLDQWESAYNALSDQYIFNRQLNQENSARLIKEMEVSYDSKNKERQIELLNLENEVISERRKSQSVIFGIGIAVLLILSAILYYLYYIKQKTNLKLIEFDQLKSKFFMNISHELRTPIALISSPLELISEDSSLAEKNRGRLDVVRQNVNRLKN